MFLIGGIALIAVIILVAGAMIMINGGGADDALTNAFGLPTKSPTLVTKSPIATAPIIAPIATTPPIVRTTISNEIVFHETGLLSGSVWWVWLNSAMSNSTTSDDIRFTTMPNGTYSYTIYVPKGHTVEVQNGTFTYNGGKQVINVAYTPILYPITFKANFESPIPAWSMQYNGKTYTSTTNLLVINDVTYGNGYFDDKFKVITPLGYHMNSYPTYVYVDGWTSTYNIGFEKLPVITFVESGLPDGTPWSIEWGLSPIRTNSSSTNKIIILKDYIGQLKYRAFADGYAAVPDSEYWNIEEDATKTIIFHKAYNVTFTATGLKTGTTWSVVFGSGGQNAKTLSSSSNQITFSNVPGGTTYNYAITAPTSGYYKSIDQGIVDVIDNNSQVNIQFTPFYTATFTQTGLPVGTPWSVAVYPVGGGAGNLGSSSNPNTQVSVKQLVDGDYYYVVSQTWDQGYVVVTRTGNITVNGGDVQQSVQFKPST